MNFDYAELNIVAFHASSGVYIDFIGANMTKSDWRVVEDQIMNIISVQQSWL